MRQDRPERALHTDQLPLRLHDGVDVFVRGRRFLTESADRSRVHVHAAELLQEPLAVEAVAPVEIQTTIELYPPEAKPNSRMHPDAHLSE